MTESRGTQVCAEAFRKMKEVRFSRSLFLNFVQVLLKLKRGHLMLKPFKNQLCSL